jgi:hypothetical protein
MLEPGWVDSLVGAQEVQEEYQPILDNTIHCPTEFPYPKSSRNLEDGPFLF